MTTAPALAQGSHTKTPARLPRVAANCGGGAFETLRCGGAGFLGREKSVSKRATEAYRITSHADETKIRLDYVDFYRCDMVRAIPHPALASSPGAGWVCPSRACGRPR